MFAIVHQMRTRIITSPAFTGERIIGAILFENTMDRDIEGQPTADYLWNVKRIVPFLKVDKGLAAEKDGVQLMKPMPELAALLDKAKAKRIFGTKMRSFIKQANGRGHQGHRDPAVRSGPADHRRGPGADRRAGSGHSLPGQGQGRRVAQGGHPRRARRTAGRSAGHAQAHLAGEGRPLRRVRQPSQGRAGWSRCPAAIRERKATGACAGITASWRAFRARWSRGCRSSNPMPSTTPCSMHPFRASSRRPTRESGRNRTRQHGSVAGHTYRAEPRSVVVLFAGLESAGKSDD